MRHYSSDSQGTDVPAAYISVDTFYGSVAAAAAAAAADIINDVSAGSLVGRCRLSLSKPR
jgi:dihydropteroate synthase